MAVLKSPPSYDTRTVEQWLARAERGRVLLPNFQRSIVWQPAKVAEYLRALLESRPTGSLLILQGEGSLPFQCRSLGEAGILESGGAIGQSEREVELVLDGQQRLTALWGALSGQAPKRYFIRVRDLSAGDAEVEQVVAKGHTWSGPRNMLRQDLVPVDVFWPPTPRTTEEGVAQSPALTIRTWCREAAGDDWEALYDTVYTLRGSLMNAMLHSCKLAKDVGRDTAVDIFINVNRSVAKLKQVDIAVALAAADHGVDLRKHAEAYLSGSSEVGHYFSESPGKAIPEVADWMLKVGCLKVRGDDGAEGLPPRQSHYPSAVNALCGGDEAKGDKKSAEGRIRALAEDLDAALRLAARNGGATRRTLPSWPAVHVIAALQEDARVLGDDLGDEAGRLLSAYLWRACVTTRYERQAQDRLLEDFQGLRRFLRAWAAWRRGESGKPAPDAPIFNTGEHPLPKSEDVRAAGWIGGASRLGKAIAAVAMRGEPLDWWTGERLTAARVRELERDRKLDRHYVFPPSQFQDAVGNDIKLGLNGVLLAKPPQGMKALDPADIPGYVAARHHGVDEFEVRNRINSHCVPWLAIPPEGAAAQFRYRKRYLEGRADAIVTKMIEFATYVPGASHGS